MSHKRRLEAEWEKFNRMVLPANAPGIQRKMMRESFFNGAMILFGLLTMGISRGDEETPEDMQLMQDLKAELDAHATQMLAESAERIRRAKPGSQH